MDEHELPVIPQVCGLCGGFGQVANLLGEAVVSTTCPFVSTTCPYCRDEDGRPKP